MERDVVLEAGPRWVLHPSHDDPVPVEGVLHPELAVHQQDPLAVPRGVPEPHVPSDVDDGEVVPAGASGIQGITPVQFGAYTKSLAGARRRFHRADRAGVGAAGEHDVRHGGQTVVVQGAPVEGVRRRDGGRHDSLRVVLAARYRAG